MFFIVQTATFAVFLGRAWQHLYWDAPYTALLWDEDWMRWLVEGILGISWQQYVSTSDGAIQLLVRSIGTLYLLCGLGAIFIRQAAHLVKPLLYIGSFSLIVLAALYAKEKFFHLGQFFEYALQWSSPLLLIALWQKQTFTPKTILWVKIAIALTFTCHGLYAVGYYPRPVGFMEMTMYILHVNNQQAVVFLQIVGTLDFLVSLMIFLPGWPGILALGYCVGWGFFTSIARIWVHFHLDFLQNLWLQWLHESLLRFPHFLIPLAVLLWKTASDRQNFRQT